MVCIVLIPPEQLVLDFNAAPAPPPPGPEPEPPVQAQTACVPDDIATIHAESRQCPSEISPEMAVNETASAQHLNDGAVFAGGVLVCANGFSLKPPIDADGRPLPIPYELKVSAKARQVYLRVEPGRGLQVTIPKRYPKRSIPALVESQRAWVTEALIDLDDKTPALYRQWPPPQLYLSACDAMVNISYSPTPDDESASVNWESPEKLHLSVDVSNKPLVAKCVATALKPFAKTLLEPWLARCARESRLHYKRMVVRGQRTVWGSYSSSGTLSLNYKLLFVRPELVEYVLLHELAHTRYLDHSPAFWRFLDELKPNAAQFDKELKEAGSLPPPWLELVGSTG